ncbi:MAG: hypothetical protein ACOWWO_11435 [Peptococcaceae bacterium]
MEIKTTGYVAKPLNNQSSLQNKSQPEKVIEKDGYIPGEKSERITYAKPSPKVDEATIEKLKAQSEQTYNHLKQIVEKLLVRQREPVAGIVLNKFSADEPVPAVEEPRREEQDLLTAGGPLSPEKISDNIVSFAKTLSGGDKSKFELLMGAIEDGFKGAAEALGGRLPEVSLKTYDLVQEKMQAWLDEE